MIISAYAGCGKSTFAKRTWNSIDMVTVPYKYVVPENTITDEGDERLKANYEYEIHPDWPRNYISAVIAAYHRYQYVIIPTIKPVLDELQRFRIPYMLFYPDRTLREEYSNRYRNRGNTEAFERIFIDGWDHFLGSLEADSYGIHYAMKTGEYLSDYRSEIETYASEKEDILQLCLDDCVMEDVKKI